ncbi:MAG TPA: rhombosortase [Steroidobacteraceae bacterium]|nr:rhombosortase [Steroidobacteraceae bacterium]
MERPANRVPSGLSGMIVPVFAVLLLQFLGLAGELEYLRPLLPSEPWRLLTGHFVHISWLHAALNGVALLLLERLFDGRLRRSEQWIVLAAAPLAISLVFWIALPELTWYRGLSGTLHAFYFAGCVIWLATACGRARWLPGAALAGGAVKVLLEQPWDATFPFQQWLGAAIVPQAHLIGALLGVTAGLLLARARRMPSVAADQPGAGR